MDSFHIGVLFLLAFINVQLSLVVVTISWATWVIAHKIEQSVKLAV